MNRYIASVLAALSLLTAVQRPALAQRIVPGEKASERVHALSSEIRWHRSLNDALAEARREGKLVFWVQMLGQIDGAT